MTNDRDFGFGLFTAAVLALILLQIAYGTAKCISLSRWLLMRFKLSRL